MNNGSTTAITPGLHAADYVIFAGMLLGTLAIGIYHALAGGRQKTTSEYLVGDRKMSVLPVTISLTASFFSSILILGFPAEAYTNGGMYWLYGLGVLLGALLATLIFVPVIHPLKLTSVNRYLMLRYDSRFVSILGTLSSAVSMLLYTGIVYFGPATALQATTSFPTWASILIASAITIVYTSIGGIKAVIWTDVFQVLLMLAGLLTVCIKGIMQVGSIGEVFHVSEEWDRMNIIDINPDPTIRFTFWSLTIGVAMYDLNRYGNQQAAVQRYSSLPSVNKARLVVLGLVPLTAVMIFLACLTGLAIFAFYTQRGCDPLRAKIINNSNQDSTEEGTGRSVKYSPPASVCVLLPHFISTSLNTPGIPGILLASIVAASLSTASSALNSCAAIVWDDVLRVIWPKLPEGRNVLLNKMLVVVFGILATGLAFAVSSIGGTLVQMIVTFQASCAGPTTAMFLIGMFTPVANWIGASVGGLVGFAFALWMGFGAYSINRQRDYLNTTIASCPSAIPTTTTTMATSIVGTTSEPYDNPLHKLYSVSYLWVTLFSMILAIVVGLIVSLLSGRMSGLKVPRRLYHPWVRRCFSNAHDDEEIIDKKVLNELQKEYDNPYMKGSTDVIERPMNGVTAATKL